MKGLSHQTEKNSPSLLNNPGRYKRSIPQTEKNSPSLLNNPGIYKRSIPQSDKKFHFFID